MSATPHSRRWIRTKPGALCAFMLLSSTAYALDIPAGTTAQISATESWITDSNPLRLVRGAQTLSGSNTIAELILGNQSPTSQISFDSTASRGIYDRSEFNSTDFHEVASASRSNQRWSAGMDGHVDYDTTRTSELSSFGITAPSIRHTGLSLAPQVSFSPNPTDKFSLYSSALRSTYDSTAFTDYSFYMLSPSYSHHFDPMNSGLLIFNAQRYSANEGAKATVDSVGPSLGWTSLIDQTLTTKLTAGIEETMHDATPGSPSSSRLNYVFSGSAIFKGQQDLSKFTASRNEQPFGNGQSSLLTSFILSEAHSLNSLITLNAGADYRFATYPASSGINLNKEISGSGGLTYHLLDTLDVNGNYQYLHQTLTGTTGAIKEQTFTVGLTYHPQIGAL